MVCTVCLVDAAQEEKKQSFIPLNIKYRPNYNYKQEACSSSANRAKPCKFVYALFRDYRRTRASRLPESESVDSSIVIRAT